MTRLGIAAAALAALFAASAAIATAQAPPPGVNRPAAVKTTKRQRPNALNPQPLPPLEQPGVAKALNPQPLPPLEQPSVAKAQQPR